MKVLVVVDMQNDFIDGALGTPEAVKIVEAVKQKIKQFTEAGEQVVYTQDTHEAHYLDTQEGRNLPVVHCVKGTEGWNLAEGIYMEGCKVIEKPSFGSPALGEYLRQFSEIEEIHLVGICTDICVITNAFLLKSYFPEVPIYVDAHCCAGVTPEQHTQALEAMKVCQIHIEND
ncbi:MAG: isochorismatase family cysteine hydrolase [Phocaeicola sp.]|nr:cysteine hydrolase [Phocaeicola sp.]MDY3914853.1 isochorismatase family cysteine hydrolase [Phocaeicola sp.]MDY5939137.1 isochorismatase family cysteine hydrolase [Phocaeicola sp.]